MAIEILKTPQGSTDAGMFNLPPAFDAKQFAAEWVLEDQVAYKQQRQNLPGCNATADGWTVWKADKMDAPTKRTGSGNKVFVLMCRPAEIQRQVNALYGNVSKKQFNNEVLGTTAAGAALQDPGILTEERLRGAIRGESAAEESVLPLNKEVATAATTSTKKEKPKEKQVSYGYTNQNADAGAAQGQLAHPEAGAAQWCNGLSTALLRLFVVGHSGASGDRWGAMLWLVARSVSCLN